jgi:hypothetical protein
MKARPLPPNKSDRWGNKKALLSVIEKTDKRNGDRKIVFVRAN